MNIAVAFALQSSPVNLRLNLRLDSYNFLHGCQIKYFTGMLFAQKVKGVSSDIDIFVNSNSVFRFLLAVSVIKSFIVSHDFFAK